MENYAPSAELESYIFFTTLDFLDNDIYGYCKIMELKRQATTRKGIIAILKLYKKIPLNTEEKHILEMYPLESEVNDNLEGCIAYVAFKICQDILNEVIDAAYRFKVTSYTIKDLTDKNGVKIDLNQIAVDCYSYIDRLEEYNKSLVHAYVFKHEIHLLTPDSELIHPEMNFEDECFIKEDELKMVMK